MCIRDRVGGYATKQAVINAVKSFNPAASPVVNFCLSLIHI